MLVKKDEDGYFKGTNEEVDTLIFVPEILIDNNQDLEDCDISDGINLLESTVTDTKNN